MQTQSFCLIFSQEVGTPLVPLELYELDWKGKGYLGQTIGSLG